jgi:hypothetical protein
VIPDFITSTEAEIAARLRHWRGEERTTLTATTQFTALPADFIEVTRVTASGTTPIRLELVASGEMQMLREANFDTAGVPAFYAITAGELELYPTPSASYDIDLAYWAKPPALSVSNTSNWVLVNYPDLYLYGAVSRGYAYLQDEGRAANTKGLFDFALSVALADGDRGKYGATTPRMKIKGY